MKSPADTQNKKRHRKDKRLKFIVTAFGALVLLTLVILITHLISQALPLAMQPTLDNTITPVVADVDGSQNNQVLASGDLMEGQPLIVQSGPCRLKMLALNEAQGKMRAFHDYVRPCEHSSKIITELEQQYIADVSGSGQARIIEVQALVLPGKTVYGTQDTTDLRSATVSFALPENVWQQRTDWQLYLAERWVVALITTPEYQFVRWINRASPTQVFDRRYATDAMVLPVPGSGNTLVFQDNVLQQFSLNRELASEPLNASVRWWQGIAKGRSLLIATDDNKLTRWVLKNQDGDMVFHPTWSVSLPVGSIPVDAAAHATSNAMALMTSDSQLWLMNRVSGDVVSEFTLAEPRSQISWYGRRLYLTSPTGVTIEEVKWLSGITTWSSLFSPQEYEGYPDATTAWQTTSGSDYQETKYSLVPLLIGSLKASLLALLIAIPVSIGAAVYSAYFSQARLRHVLKPAIELLEAIPSVLIGFIAAIWLAPMAESVLFSFAFFLLVVPVILFIAAFFQHRVARKLPASLRRGSELIILPLLVLALGYISMHWAQDWLFAMFDVEGFAALTASSESPIGKTTIVVALALGVAISPTIYSLAEDAINGVPEHLKHASFALGATRLQTLQYVVLQLAMPGILAAIMMGFGRAFGETMIVLMVTGNTPVSDWSLLEGLRALTANLAIELPETDINSAHYQILFFTACILFGFTFVVNTLAELLRQRLRLKARHD